MAKKATPKIETKRKVKEIAPEAPKAEAPAEATPVAPESMTPALPIIDGIQAIEVIGENETATHYKMANQTTTWFPK
jgi:hypothetical protein